MYDLMAKTFFVFFFENFLKRVLHCKGKGKNLKSEINPTKSIKEAIILNSFFFSEKDIINSLSICRKGKLKGRLSNLNIQYMDCNYKKRQ